MKFKQTVTTISRISENAPLGVTPSGAIIFEVVGIPADQASRMRYFFLPLTGDRLSFSWVEVEPTLP